MALKDDKYESIYSGEEVDSAITKVREASGPGNRIATTEDLKEYVTTNLAATATVTGDGSQPPSVHIATGGNAAQTVLHFTFDNIKGNTGEKGEVGATPVISADATVGQTTGVPEVTVTKSGTDENPVFSFAFSNLKGETGNDGAVPEVTATASVSNTVGTPSVVVTPSTSGNTTTFHFAFSNLKGEKGDKGDDGAAATRYVTTITSSNWSGSSAPYTYSIPASTHQKGANCSVQIKDSSTGEVYGATILIAPSTGNVTIKSNVKIGLIIEIWN